jgi:uncharacterized membrane-anchored protein YitT (DUF2179 family)
MNKYRIDFDQVLLAFAIAIFIFGVFQVDSHTFICGLCMSISTALVIGLWGKTLREHKELDDE